MIFKIKNKEWKKIPKEVIEQADKAAENYNKDDNRGRPKGVKNENNK